MTGTYETVTDLSVVTPDIARDVWESFERSGRRPTARAVALAIAQSGKYLPVSYRTIARWAKNNWRPQLRLVKSHPLREVAKKVDAAVPVLTGDPLTRASDVSGVLDFDSQSLRCEVHALSDEELAGLARIVHQRDRPVRPNSKQALPGRNHARRTGDAYSGDCCIGCHGQSSARPCSTSPTG